MKKLFLFTAIIFAISLQSFAQLSEGGTPYSFYEQSSISDIDAVLLNQPDLKSIKYEDSILDINKTFLRYGISAYCDLSPQNSGEWTYLNNGDKLWRLKITVPKAQALGIYYDRFILPEGSKLFLYNEDKSQVIGAFTYKNNHSSELFANELIQGETVILEYYQSASVSKEAILHINEIAYCYRNSGFKSKTYEFGSSASCEVNVNCSEGTNYQNQKRGVARISVKVGSSYGWCSGSLINNVAQNCTPYFLTADHCALDGSNNHASASDLNQWMFYFKYESAGCTNGTEPTPVTMTGCTMKANGGLGGETGSDFFLVQFNSAVPTSINAYFNGWSRNTPTSSGVSIHHPSGDIKKISSFTSAPTSTTWVSVAGTHWQVYWATTTNGHGVTEGGSSGSPLFDNTGKLIGTLTGGGSACVNGGAGTGTGPTQPDAYGKFSYHWASNGTTNAAKLQPWLDPSNTGATSLGGCNCPNNTLTADFYANTTNISVGGTVTFTSSSSGNPTSWAWTFSGGNPSSYNGQTPPSIRYSAAGSYNVSLTVSNGTTNNTNTKTAYIVVSNTPPVSTCDTLSNVLATEMAGLTIYGFTGQTGTWTGHNGYNETEFADKFTNSGTKYIKGIFYAPATAHAGNSSSKLTFKVYADGTTPGSTLVSKDVLMSSMSINTWNYVQFNSPVAVSGNFYLGYQIYYVANDTFALYMVADRLSGTATAYSKGTSWSAFSDYTLFSSLALAGIVCTSTGINDNNLIDENGVVVFPNPSTGLVNILFTEPNVNPNSIKVYDMFGKIIENINLKGTTNNSYEIDLSGRTKGLYIISIEENNKRIVRKVSLQ